MSDDRLAEDYEQTAALGDQTYVLELVLVNLQKRSFKWPWPFKTPRRHHVIYQVWFETDSKTEAVRRLKGLIESLPQVKLSMPKKDGPVTP